MTARLSTKDYHALLAKQGLNTTSKAKVAKAPSPAMKKFEAQFYGEPEMIIARDTPHYNALSYLQRHPEQLYGSIESYEQTFVMHFFEINFPDIYEYMLAVPNAGKRTKRERGNLLAEGLKKGVPDIFVEKAIDPFHGLRIELKKTLGTTNDVSPVQWEWLERYEREGYQACVAIGYRECIILICQYFNVSCRFASAQKT